MRQPVQGPDGSPLLFGMAASRPSGRGLRYDSGIARERTLLRGAARRTMDAPEQTLTNEQIRDFVIAGHGNLPRVREMLMENPDLLNASYQWREGDSETALQAAAQAGSTTV